MHEYYLADLPQRMLKALENMAAFFLDSPRMVAFWFYVAFPLLILLFATSMNRRKKRLPGGSPVPLVGLSLYVGLTWALSLYLLYPWAATGYRSLNAGGNIPERVFGVIAFYLLLLCAVRLFGLAAYSASSVIQARKWLSTMIFIPIILPLANTGARIFYGLDLDGVFALRHDLAPLLGRMFYSLLPLVLLLLLYSIFWRFYFAASGHVASLKRRVSESAELERAEHGAAMSEKTSAGAEDAAALRSTGGEKVKPLGRQGNRIKFALARFEADGAGAGQAGIRKPPPVSKPGKGSVIRRG